MQTYMPMLIVRMKEGKAAIQLNGTMVGEAGVTSHVALPVSESGDYYIGVFPIAANAERYYPVMRKLSFRSGKLEPVVCDDLDVYAWPEGVFEAVFTPGCLPRFQEIKFPYTISQVRLRDRCIATLYYDLGMKFAVEEGFRIRYGTALGEERAGRIRLLRNGWLAVYCGEPRHMETDAAGEYARILFLLDDSYREIIRVEGDAVSLRAEDEIVRFSRLNTSLGHDLKQTYRLKEGRFEKEAAVEIGFFMHSPKTELSGKALLHAFCDAVRYNLWDEAMSYLSVSLKEGLNQELIRECLGDFTGVRSPIGHSDKSMGLLYQKENGITPVRVFSFEFAEGQIDNIAE